MWYSTLFYFLFCLFFWFAINELLKEPIEEEKIINELMNGTVIVLMVFGFIGSAIALIKNLFHLIGG